MRSDKKTDKVNPVIYLFRKTWQHSEGRRWIIVLYMLMFVVSECVNTFWSPIVLAKVMNTVQLEGITETSLKKLMFLILMFPVGSVLSWAFHGPARYMEETNAFLARAEYRRRQLSGVMNMPLEWHNEHHSGDTIDRMEKGASAVYEFSSETFQFLKPVVKLIGCFGAVVYFSNVSAVFVVAIMIIGAIITVKIDSICGPLIRDLSRQENKVAESVFDSISNISTVITLRVEAPVFASIMQKVMAPLQTFKRNARLNELKWFLTSLCCSVMTVLVLGVYFFEHQSGTDKLAIGSLYLIVSYLDKISDLFYQFTSLYGWTIRRKFRLLNGDELANDFRQESFSNHVLPKDWKVLEVSDLNFSYAGDQSKSHLDDVSMTIRRGQKIAFVGGTGSGKTTMLRVIRDLHHPDQVTLRSDGHLVEDGFSGISRAISLVPQKPEIFATTILSNLTLGVDRSDLDIDSAMTMACFKEVVENLPSGLESSIKEKGVNLSEGQTQRLALSRGLLASLDKDILLLDEPTSSLDVSTEMTVYRNIFKGFPGKTIISSIHRLHLLPMFDVIFMFEDGKIVGSGTLAEMLENCPQFATLWQKQYEV